MVKIGEGLDFTLKDFGLPEGGKITNQLHETPSKVFRIIAKPDEVIIRVSFVIKSNNYSQNFHQFL
jgi:hypothetical protein